MNATNDASGDSVKVDSINISTLSGTSIVSANFDDVVGTQLDQVAVTSGENTLNFNYPGHLTDGTGNLIIGYSVTGSTTLDLASPPPSSTPGKTFRKVTFNEPLNTATVADTAFEPLVFEVIVSGYDLSAAWDANRSSGSYTGKGVQFMVQSSDTQKGALVELSTYNSLTSDSILHLDFDDASGTNLKDSVAAGTVTGTWSNGGPQTHNGSLGIGYTPAYIWTIKNGEGTSETENAYRTFELTDSLPLGKYIIETRIDGAELSGAWQGAGTPVVTNKGVEVIVKQSDNSGVKLSLLSHDGANGYAPKVSSSIVSGSDSTDAAQVYPPSGTVETGTNSDGEAYETTTKTEYRIPEAATLDMQILVDTRSGVWTSRVKNSSVGDTSVKDASTYTLHENDVVLSQETDADGNITSYTVSNWRDLETNGTGFTDIKSIQLNTKTPSAYPSSKPNSIPFPDRLEESSALELSQERLKS